MSEAKLKIALVVLALCIAGVLLMRLEKYSETVNLGWRDEARYNTYLAAEKFLRQRLPSVTSEEYFSTASELDGIDTIVVPDASYLKVESLQNSLLAWLNQGGHLIVGIGKSDNPPLLGKLGFESYLDDDVPNTQPSSEDFDWLNELVEGDFDEEASEQQEDSGENSRQQDSQKGSKKDSLVREPFKRNNTKEKVAENSETSPEADKEIATEEAKEKPKSMADRMREHNRELLARKREQEEEIKNQSDEEAKTKIRCLSSRRECNTLEEPKVEEKFITVISFNGIADKLQVYAPSRRFISHPTFNEDGIGGDINYQDYHGEIFYAAGNTFGDTFVQAKLGEGMISIVSQGEIFASHRIGHFDHAYLLQVLTENTGRVALLFGKDAPSLGALILTYFFEAVVTGAILIALIILYYARRFGLAIELQAEGRRSRLERMSAAAQFRWRIKDSDGLVKGLRSDVMRKANRRWPGFARWLKTKQLEHLGTLCEYSEEAVDQALYLPLHFNEQQFTNYVRLLQSLRKAL